MIRLTLTPEQAAEIAPMVELMEFSAAKVIFGQVERERWPARGLVLTVDLVDGETARKIKALLKKPSPASALPPRQGPDDVQAVPPRN
jgi:hypothetical protein